MKMITNATNIQERGKQNHGIDQHRQQKIVLFQSLQEHFHFLFTKKPHRLSLQQTQHWRFWNLFNNIIDSGIQIPGCIEPRQWSAWCLKKERLYQSYRQCTNNLVQTQKRLLLKAVTWIDSVFPGIETNS